MFNDLGLEKIINYLEIYDNYFLFIIMYLEHLNFPGLPAGLIMPAVGILVSQGTMPMIRAMLISLMGGVLGSISLYAIGYHFGFPLLNWLSGKSKKTKKTADKLFVYFDKYGNKSVLFVRFIPVARTIISFVAGVAKLNIMDFVVNSAIGIFIWNLVLVGLGYFFGYRFL